MLHFPDSYVKLYSGHIQWYSDLDAHGHWAIYMLWFLFFCCCFDFFLNCFKGLYCFTVF